ncbi:type I glyceraldehyde-3-phosphate dehydrogenase [Candidatus Dependentiae bacterium]|nr:type I glyceraldehyde-3-phosphate dehydrogenase [Candidatus Dependentiae bacterium]
MSKKIAINGFGRIGKAFLRTIMQDPNTQNKLSVVAINIGPSNPESLANFFCYDSTLGKFKGSVSYENKKLTINSHSSHTIEIVTEPDPTKLPWGKLNIDFVVEASGLFTTREKAAAHLKSGAKKVLVTAPAQNEDITIIPGVNDNQYDANKHAIISLGSCTTNCFAPMVKVLKSNFTLQQGFMTTVHAYTNNQALLDSEHEDPRRGRAAAINIIPTNTGASKVITKIYPDLEGRLLGSALRVPVAVVSLVDFTFTTDEQLSASSINQAFEHAAQNDLKDILQVTKEPLVSSDFIGSPYSCIIDSPLTNACGTMGKISGWYDNEFGYSMRLKDFLLHI